MNALVISATPMKDAIMQFVGSLEARGFRVNRLKLTMAQLRAVCRDANCEQLFSERALKWYVERSGCFTVCGIPVTLTDGTEITMLRSLCS